MRVQSKFIAKSKECCNKKIKVVVASLLFQKSLQKPSPLKAIMLTALGA